MPSPRLTPQTELSQRTLAIVMAGGNGSRLGDLTRSECKPALPFGGQYRNIDFPLSNCVNSGIRRIALATQYKAHSLIQHVQRGWTSSRPGAGEFIELWPAQQRCGGGWYSGTADAIYQNLDLIEQHAADYVLILAGDHVYKMDYRLMLAEHAANHADVTIGCFEVPLESAGAFGVLETDEHHWVTRFDEKPTVLPASPADSGVALASMGIYAFNRAFLAECLESDAADSGSRHDFGRNVLPAVIAGAGRVLGHAFRDAGAGGPAYWRDVGTIDSYWHANMELLAERPELNLHDDRWPIWTHQTQCPPPIFTGQGFASRSIVAGGCGIAGTVEHSVLSQRCVVGSGSVVESSVVLPDVTIGRDCRIRRAIIETGCTIPDGVEVGGDAYEDEESCRYSAERIAVITSAAVERAMAHASPPKVAYIRR
jgi:glucose-1-phosphate adenylyltransferase